MELQAALVNSRIDDLRQTAHETHAMTTVERSASGSAYVALRRGLGLRLISLGLALASPESGSEARPAAMA